MPDTTLGFTYLMQVYSSSMVSTELLQKISYLLFMSCPLWLHMWANC